MYVTYLVKTSFFPQPHMSLHFWNTCITSFTSSEGQTEFANPYGKTNIQINIMTVLPIFSIYATQITKLWQIA